MNKILLLGRLIQDPEMKVMEESGKVLTKFILAVQRTMKNSNGERESDFLPVVLWGKKAETASEYLSKGSLITVCGRMQTRSYEDKDGNRKFSYEVVAEEFQFVEAKKVENSAV